MNSKKEKKTNNKQPVHTEISEKSKFDDPMYNKGYDDGFSDAANSMEIDTPIGTLSVELKGTEQDYPGIVINITSGSNDTAAAAVIEYNTLKRKLQAVVYKNCFCDDSVYDVIEINNPSDFGE